MLNFIDKALSVKAQHMNRAAANHPLLIELKNATDKEPAEILLHGEVGNPYENMDSGSVGSFLRANRGAPVVLRINSGGGAAFDGIAIHNALRQHDGRVTALIEGIAGSAASIIAVGAHRVKMFENASFMIHRASVVAAGNEETMDEAKMILRQLDHAIAITYKAKNGRAMEKIREWMVGPHSDGTWFTAQQAVAEKFVDEVLPLKAAPPPKSHLASLPERQQNDIMKRYPSGLAARIRIDTRVNDGIFKA